VYFETQLGFVLWNAEEDSILNYQISEGTVGLTNQMHFKINPYLDFNQTPN